MKPFWSCLATGLLLTFFSAVTHAEYSDWKHSGVITILTTPDGADLPAGVVVEEFPLLVSLHKDWFDFQQAAGDGADIRFSSSAGIALSYQIDEWSPALGTATLWVRIPRIEGNARQTIRMHWGQPKAASESNGKAVFNGTNGYLSVWHMSDPVTDEVGTIDSKDEGTTATRGMIGPARHLEKKQGISGGEAITAYPSGTGPMTTEAWFRAQTPNSTVLAWGKEKRPSKVMMNFLSPPRVAIQCYFADVEAQSLLTLNTWYHVVHTYREKDSRVYVNGQLEGATTPVLDIPTISSLWIGGWYNNYNFVGDIDEVRLSNLVRSAEWVRLQYENQKPLQTLVGPIVQPGNAFTVSANQLTVPEGGRIKINAEAGGAEKIYWTLSSEGVTTLLASDRFTLDFNAGRVTRDKTATLELKAVKADQVQTKLIPITITESIPEPIFTLTYPTAWDGRTAISVVPEVSNRPAMQAKGAGDLTIKWAVAGIATIRTQKGDQLLLSHAFKSGPLTVTATASNGGKPTVQTATITVTEPNRDIQVARIASPNEKPVDNQFYAREANNLGTLFYNGQLEEAAESVFLRVTQDEKPFAIERQKPTADKSYAFSIQLKPGLTQYKVEFGTQAGNAETVTHTVSNIVCGDAYIIQGQSNALATDTGEKSPPETNVWIRSYGRPEGDPLNPPTNLWCNPVWKAQKGEKAELGWWGMELAKRLVERQKMPICIINGAVGGTRIDQHQRNESNPTDLATIYGRMLWRVEQAKLKHAIRGILWHQGESDQGSDGPTRGYGWETYQEFFVDMSAGWKRDFPNLNHIYVFQIWPDACSMGGRQGSGDRLREAQRTLPDLYSHLSVMPTVGIKPPGPCHFPLQGWSQIATLIQPLIERDFYGKAATPSILPPNLKRASYTSAQKDAVILEFDQPVVWTDALKGQFYFDGAKDQIESGAARGTLLTLTLKEPSSATKMTYLKEAGWSQDLLLLGTSGIPALTFCDLPLLEFRK